MISLITLFIGMNILSKAVKIIKDVVLSILSIVATLFGVLIFFRYLYKWIIVPLWKFLKWTFLKLKEGFFLLCEFLDRHYSYRQDNKYWREVATSMDRKPL